MMHSKNKILAIDNLHTSCCLISFGPLCYINFRTQKSPILLYLNSCDIYLMYELDMHVQKHTNTQTNHLLVERPLLYQARIL